MWYDTIQYNAMDLIDPSISYKKWQDNFTLVQLKAFVFLS